MTVDEIAKMMDISAVQAQSTREDIDACCAMAAEFGRVFRPSAVAATTLCSAAAGTPAARNCSPKMLSVVPLGTRMPAPPPVVPSPSAPVAVSVTPEGM